MKKIRNNIFETNSSSSHSISISLIGEIESIPCNTILDVAQNEINYHENMHHVDCESGVNTITAHITGSLSKLQFIIIYFIYDMKYVSSVIKLQYFMEIIIYVKLKYNTNIDFSGINNTYVFDYNPNDNDNDNIFADTLMNEYPNVETLFQSFIYDDLKYINLEQKEY